MSTSTDKPQRRSVPADLIESTPSSNAAGHWVLASPVLLFLLWLWSDLIAYLSPLPTWVDWFIGALLYMVVIVLPLGLLAYWIVTSLPRIFHHAGWDIHPLEQVSEAEQYMVRYAYQHRIKAESTWRRRWMRAGQGWVYLEIAIILLGAVAMIPLFLSATDYGFGR